MDPHTIAGQWSDSLAAGRSRLYVASDGERIVGYAGVGPERDAEAPAGTGELYALYVHPDSWGSGVGRVLADAAVADLQGNGCRAIWLWVLEANTRARHFYTRYGFIETGARSYSSLGNLPEIRLTLPTG